MRLRTHSRRRRRKGLPRGFLLLLALGAAWGGREWLRDPSFPIPTAQIESAGKRKSAKAPVPVQESHLEFISCHDGDTCRARSPDGFQLNVRLAAVDAPEVAKNRGPKKNRHGGQAYGREAKEFLVNRVVGKKIPVRVLGNDHYNRYLVLIVDEKLQNTSKTINEELIAKGMAFAYTERQSDEKLKEWATAAELKARNTKTGMWGLAQPPESPEQFRKQNR